MADLLAEYETIPSGGTNLLESTCLEPLWYHCTIYIGKVPTTTPPPPSSKVFNGNISPAWKWRWTLLEIEISGNQWEGSFKFLKQKLAHFVCGKLYSYVGSFVVWHLKNSSTSVCKTSQLYLSKHLRTITKGIEKNYMFWEGEEGTFYISSSPKNLCTHWKCSCTTQYFNGFGTTLVIFKIVIL